MIEEILDLCLNEIRAKRATVADCLKKYPQYAKELEPLLETAFALEAVPDVKPSLAFKLRTRAQLANLPSPALLPRAPFFPRLSFATAAAMILAILGLGAGLVYAAGDSLPDSPFYLIKRGAEGIQIRFASDPASQARTYMTFAERRLDEAKALASKPDQNALAEQAIVEYNIQVDASLAAAPLEQTSSAPLAQELTNRITLQQDALKTLEKKISSPTLEKALSGSVKAKEKLNAVASPQPTGIPISAPSPLLPTLPPVTPSPAPSTTPTPPLSPTVPVTATPVLTPPISLPPITIAAPTLAIPNVVPKPPTEVPIPKLPPIVPPVPGLPTLKVP